MTSESGSLGGLVAREDIISWFVDKVDKISVILAGGSSERASRRASGLLPRGPIREAIILAMLPFLGDACGEGSGLIRSCWGGVVVACGGVAGCCRGVAGCCRGVAGCCAGDCCMEEGCFKGETCLCTPAENTPLFKLYSDLITHFLEQSMYTN